MGPITKRMNELNRKILLLFSSKAEARDFLVAAVRGEDRYALPDPNRWAVPSFFLQCSQNRK